MEVARQDAERPPVFTWCVTVAFASLMGVWAFLTPLTRAPDELAHIDLVFHLAAGHPYPDHDGRPTGSEAFDLALTHGQMGLYAAAGHPHRTAASAAIGNLDDPYDATEDVPARWVGNQMPQHPPLYYESASWVVRASRSLPGERSFSQEVQLVRLFGAAMVSALPLLTWSTARRLGTGTTAAMAASAVPLLVPQLAHIGASVNNDTMLALLMATTAWLSARVPTGDLRVSGGLEIGVVAGLAALTKGFALLLPLWIALVYLTALRGPVGRRHRLAAIRAYLAAMAAFAAVAGWFWVRNLVVHGRVSPSIQSSFPALGEFTVQPRHFAEVFVRNMSVRFWGEFGYHEFPLRPGFVWLLSIASVLAIASAFLRRPDRTPDPQGSLSRWPMAVFGSIAAFLLSFSAIRAWSLYVDNGQIRFVQGRYLFGAIIAIAIPLGVGLARLAGRWTLPVLTASAVVVQAEGIRTALRAWWGRPDDTLAGAVRTIPHWYPGTGAVFWLFAAGLFTSTVWLLALAWRHTGRPHRGSTLT